MNLGTGYNVGCHFRATITNSELGEKASRNNLKCLVGSFHGHTHNWLYQLSFLTTYVEGMGIEDLEGFKWARQVLPEITTYTKHFDSFETYANLSKCLSSKYHQALAILKTEPMLLNWMRQEGMDSYSRFHDWLREEKDYLLSLKDAQRRMWRHLRGSMSRSWLISVRGKVYRSAGGRKVELARRHGKEKVERDLESVQELERQLEVVDRWTPVSPRSESNQLVLDALKLLIVERIFELTKMNWSQTGCKMRKHIAKALQAWSKVVRNAIDRYNSAASLLDPLVFLMDIDILRDTHAEIQPRPWTHLAYWLAMDRYFKILHARKEAELNSVVGKMEEEAAADQGMAVQFWALAKAPGFMGTVMPGVSVELCTAQREAQAQAAAQANEERFGPEGASGGIGVEHDGEEQMVVDAGDEGEWVEEEDEGDDAMEEAVSDLLYTISMVAIDGKGEPPQCFWSGFLLGIAAVRSVRAGGGAITWIYEPKKLLSPYMLHMLQAICSIYVAYVQHILQYGGKHLQTLLR
ncbi:hypothetical protein B0H14DRAFT_2604148 [Mycena olivaceomarginata]|nr:hypothetical protein B0H14DRAFT_2604148 [Mycena olivaceomarginata]